MAPFDVLETLDQSYADALEALATEARLQAYAEPSTPPAAQYRPECGMCRWFESRQNNNGSLTQVCRKYRDFDGYLTALMPTKSSRDASECVGFFDVVGF